MPSSIRIRIRRTLALMLHRLIQFAIPDPAHHRTASGCPDLRIRGVRVHA